MATVRIAHLSDLHFGAAGVGHVWDLLTHHFADPERRPHLVLLTGDLVNSPSDALFAAAYNAIESLCGFGQIPYFVCAGNHDRHFWGNTTGWKVWRKKIERVVASSTHFFDKFGGRVANLQTPQIVPLGDWRVEVVGIDSSVEADHFARGFIPLQVKQQLEGVGKDPGQFDLAIMLVHHHLMPVRALEEERQGRLKSLVDLTGLVNAGSLVEAFANNHIDIALHGHEHVPNWARYEALESGGRTVIAGAGSATGMKTGEGGAATRSCFSTIELDDDLSVSLRIWRHDPAEVFKSDPAIKLLAAEDLRRAGLLRRAGRNPQTRQRILGSEIVKYVEFTREHDGLVRETQTNWQVSPGPDGQGTWSKVVRNRTGEPADPRVRFVGAAGDHKPKLAFELLQGEDYAWVTRCQLPPAYARSPLQVEIAYNWFGGAILTEEELGALDDQAKGPFRRKGYEFAAATVNDPLKALTLVVILPPEFAPPAEDQDSQGVVAFVQDASEPNSDEDSPPEIARCLNIRGRGLYALSVPYPEVGRRYIVAWKPISAKTLRVPPEATRFRDLATREGDRLANILREALESTPLKGATIAIYLPEAKETLSLAGATSDIKPVLAPKVNLGEKRHLLTLGWRAGVTPAVMPEGATLGADDLEAGFQPGERAVITVPLRSSLAWTNGLPWAVGRIGLSKLDAQARNLLSPQNGTALRDVLISPIMKVLVA